MLLKQARMVRLWNLSSGLTSSIKSFFVFSSWLGADGADHRLAARIQNADLCRKTAKCPTFAPELHQNPVRW